jgi:uncharacterized protein YbbC (DUF1343 family)
MNRIKIQSGADRLLDESQWRERLAGSRVGAVVNHTAVTGSYEFWPSLLAGRTGAGLELIFTPEHGLWGEQQDQVASPATAESELGARAVSLYLADPSSLRPDPSLMTGLDAVLFDIQDVGSRYYTYVYTLAFAMEAAAEAGVKVIVLDRPNPIGGTLVEGPLLNAGFESFVGRFAGLPARHGLSAGELALWFHKIHGIGQKPEVITAKNWRREDTAFNYDCPWVLPSPNMPTPVTALAYPGMCLLEGTILSEGRGTTRPFEIFGAPWLNPFDTARLLNSLELPGVRFRPQRFIPTFNKFERELCGGCQLHVTDREAFRPFITGAAVIWAAAKLDGEGSNFGWLERAYEFVEDIPAIDLLFGDSSFRLALDEGCDFDEVRGLCHLDEEAWMEQCGGVRLYQ